MTRLPEKVDEAAVFAVAFHGGQMYGDKPYSYHLFQVRDKVKDEDEDTQVVAILHDVLEDTKATYRDIQTKFGREVAEAVARLTKVKGVEYTDYIEGVRSNPIALKVKIADTLCNLTQSHKEGNLKRIRKYSKQMYLLTK